MLMRGEDLSTYLIHHGIKGQKWGVRRFQDAAGSLTAAGKARYRDYVDTRKGQKEYEKDLKKRFKESRSEYRKARREDSFFNRNKPGKTREERHNAHAEAEKKYMDVSKEYNVVRNRKRAGYSTYDRGVLRKSDEQFGKDGKILDAVKRDVKIATKSTAKQYVNKEVGKRVRNAVIKAAVGYAALKLVKRYYGKKADSIGLPGPVNNKARDIIDVLPNGKVKVSRSVESITVDQVYEAVKDFAKDMRYKMPSH